MFQRDHLRPLAACAALLLSVGLAACGDDDDGAAVRDDEDASVSASASGIAEDDVDAETDNELVLAAVDEYQEYVIDQVDELIAINTEFTDAVRAGDVALAQSLFAEARAPWERIEPIAGLISDIDGAVDARVDDFANEEDPTWTGWHRIEYLLFEANDIAAAAPFADQLDEDLLTLQDSLPDLELPPAALAVGAAELIQEVSEGKVTGEEDRYSHTDLSDFLANVEGAQVLIDALRPALEEADPELLAEIDDGFDALLEELTTHQNSDGSFVPYTDLTEDQIDALVALLAPLSEDMALVAGVLGLEFSAVPGDGRDGRGPQPLRLSRRALLRGAAVAGTAIVVGAACSDDDTTENGSGAAAGDSLPPPPAHIEFRGPHQNGITQPATPVGVMAALDVQLDDRDELADAIRTLSEEAERVMGGEPPEQRPPAFPPVDSGVLGAEPPPLDLSVIVGFGATLFDDRFGLADRLPRELEVMPFSPNDRLDPARSHGDISLTVSAVHLDAAMFGLRQLLRATRGAWTLRWMQEGFNSPVADPTPGGAPVRNLLGFKDGTNNLSGADAEAMDRFVWVQADDGEPGWAAGGSYQVIRTIRMFVEFWDRTQLVEQENLIGRHKVSGAPLGQELETDPVDFEGDPDGELVALESHIRRASPGTPDTADSRILRRGFSFSNGFDGADQLDQGLLFASFQRTLSKGFKAVQARLDGEGLEEYIRPVGGGFFFCPPGVDAPDGYLGEGLFRS